MKCLTLYSDPATAWPAPQMNDRTKSGQPMNKDAILFHLKEAKEELDRTIASLESDPGYGPEEFSIAAAHLYHHLNTAWNGRDESEAAHRECGEENFHRWRRFPTNEEFLFSFADGSFD